MINSINTTLNPTTSNPTIFNQTGSESFTNYLSNETSLKIDTTKKPNIKEFRDFTGMSFKEASSILYGVIGSNQDTRDWNKILTSADVLKTAKEETALMYQQDTSFNTVSNSEQTSFSSDTSTLSDTTITDTNPITIFADVQEGNIKFTQISKYDEKTQSDKVTNSLYLATSNGNVLRYAGNTPSQIVENIDAFGFDTKQLETLSQNDLVPIDIKTLLLDTLNYYNSVFSTSNALSSTKAISTLDLLFNNLNTVDNS